MFHGPLCVDAVLVSPSYIFSNLLCRPHVHVGLSCVITIIDVSLQVAAPSFELRLMNCTLPESMLVDTAVVVAIAVVFVVIVSTCVGAMGTLLAVR